MTSPAAVLSQLDALCADIAHFIEHAAPTAQYAAPVIDWLHPRGYAQHDIVGLKRFRAGVEVERAHVAAVSGEKWLPGASGRLAMGDRGSKGSVRSCAGVVQIEVGHGQ
jgi:hypothetical protein